MRGNALKFLKSAKQQEEEEINHLFATCKMIDQRRRVDKTIKREKRASQWPSNKVLATPESLITNIVEFCEFLKNDGYSEEESIRKIATFSNQALSQENVNLVSYLKLRLEASDPSYLALGPDLLNAAAVIAVAYARKVIEKRRSETPFPPVGWLGEKIAHDNVSTYRNTLCARTLDGKDGVIEAPVPESRDWIRFQLRIKPDDEIRSFSGSLIPGSGLGYRAGMALVRNGVPIEHIVTIRG